MAQATSRWNPYQIRRCVRMEGAAPDGIAMFVSKSFTTETADDVYHPAIDLETGAVTCDCPHFFYRLAKHEPTLYNGGKVCKHLERAIQNLARRGRN